jgi:hypothetical protein
MAGLKSYSVQINGIDHVVRLDDKDAKRLGVTAEQEVKAGTAANKAGTADNKSK